MTTSRTFYCRSVHMARQVGDVLFDRRDIIGWGPTGTVILRGTWGQEPVAVKRFLTAPLKILDGHKLVQCDHKNILRLYDVITLKGFTYFTLELCSCNLTGYLANSKGPEISSRAILQQTTQGLAYLHSMGVIHRALKPTNILLCLPTDSYPQVTVKLSDFGTISKWSNDTWPGCDPDSSEGWLSPEQLKGGHKITSAADIFLLGCIFYVTLTSGQHPFGSLPYFRNQKILAGQQDLSALLADRDIVPVASELIEWMIQRQPEHRPSIERVLSHPDFWLE